MSDSEEENFCFFGKPLEPYDEDAFPKKKPISVEDQIATDAQGRRRFHGAFTGGFSAGFYNTVGSLEGWTPSEFKSTRQEKAQNISQKPEDFMDDEDIGEFGIAPQTVKATKEFSTAKKRKRQIFSDGPIPGVPVLETLLTSGNETVGYLLLKNIGIEEKLAKQKEVLSEPDSKVYGCQMPTGYKISESIENRQYTISEIYKEFLANPKCNTFGLGYKGLGKSHINLFQSTNLVMEDRNNKKVSIGGQAFGIGAFEDDDEDIYAKEDMSNYDFVMTKEKKLEKKDLDTSNLIFGMFKHSKMPLVFKKSYPAPNIPHSFTGIHKVRKSRFEPVEKDPAPVERKSMNPQIRAKYLGEEAQNSFTESKPIIERLPKGSKPDNKKNETTDEDRGTKKGFDISCSFISDKFVSASQKEDISNILEPVQKTETMHGTPQMRDAAKMKMFGLLTRITTDWCPCSILCKRFNVPEPSVEPDDRKKKRTKNLIFEYQKHIDVNESTLQPGLSGNVKDERAEIAAIEEKNETHLTMEVVEEITQIESSLVTESTSQISPVEHLENLKEESEPTPPPKDITEKIDVAEKQDLFKAVFLSSSESEDETKEEKEDNTRAEELKSNVLSDPLLPKIKPLKEGILSNVSFHKFSKPKAREESATDDKNIDQSEGCSVSTNTTIIAEQIDSLSYGPKLPSYKIETTSRVSIVSSNSEDEWIEKTTDIKKKAKHKKKHKKEKHKKHKSDKKDHKGAR